MIADQTGEPVLCGRQPTNRKKYHKSLAQDAKRKKQSQNCERAPVHVASIWICYWRCARAWDDELYLFWVFRCHAEKLRLKLRIVAAALENYLGFALEPTRLHHAQDRRSEPH